ncbi:2OG-Fe(II) oxygenase [Dongia sp.]|uniref:2OG-Fe(II) oxygenase family protein n=1 Tax=Dongia sp. TaxID=1977262 RepID=UPI003750C2E5
MTEARNQLLPGDPAPVFRAPSNINPDFDFSTAAGRYLVLSFLGPLEGGAAKTRFDAFLGGAAIFTNPDCYFFGLVAGKADDGEPALRQQRPGMDMFWDDGTVAHKYGAVAPVSFLIGLDLRVLAVVAEPDPVQHAAALYDILKRLPQIGPHRPGIPLAPVLMLPSVFEPSFCRRLIEGYEIGGAEESGFMRERDGKTVMVIDHKHKRRSDWTINDEALKEAARARILRRVIPEIQKAFQFRITRMERYIVACYDAAVGGYFQAHRDNTTKGTAHRRFAVTVNLNSDEYEGGELTFPEYGRTIFKPPVGGAVVFSCSLLHRALPVTKGKRYAFLPFLYDDAAAKIREANNAYLGDNVQQYKSG